VASAPSILATRDWLDTEARREFDLRKPELEPAFAQ